MKHFQRAICGLPLCTATSLEEHGDASFSISSIQLHGPEGGSIFQNAWSRGLAGTDDEGRQQQVGLFILGSGMCNFIPKL